MSSRMNIHLLKVPLKQKKSILAFSHVEKYDSFFYWPTLSHYGHYGSSLKKSSGRRYISRCPYRWSNREEPEGCNRHSDDPSFRVSPRSSSRPASFPHSVGKSSTWGRDFLQTPWCVPSSTLQLQWHDVSTLHYTFSVSKSRIPKSSAQKSLWNASVHLWSQI